MGARTTRRWKGPLCGGLPDGGESRPDRSLDCWVAAAQPHLLAVAAISGCCPKASMICSDCDHSSRMGMQAAQHTSTARWRTIPSDLYCPAPYAYRQSSTPVRGNVAWLPSHGCDSDFIIPKTLSTSVSR
jgi:hypothetical protein